MDCQRAQELISDALDKLPVDQPELSDAKQHCRDCADCAAFVRALLAMQKSPLPAPAPDLADRVMAAVRREAAMNAAREPASAIRHGAAPDAGDLGAEPVGEPARDWRDLVRRATDPRHRRALVGWSAAAAVLLLAAGFGAIAGVRAILIPPRIVEMEYAGVQQVPSTADTQLSSPYADESRTAEKDAASPEAAVPNSAGFIVVDGSVYRFASLASDVNPSSLSRVGTTRSALDQQSSPEQHDVFGSGELSRVYIEDGDRVLAFDRVTRTYDGASYVLQSGPLDGFGQSPTFPPEITRPANADGSPVFREDGTDEYGTTVYEPVSSQSGDGIAIAPGTGPVDPMPATTDWTWWARLR